MQSMTRTMPRSISKTSTGARYKFNARRVFDYLIDRERKSIMDYFKVTKRCIRCLKPLRENGTCQNVKCVRYKPDPESEKKQEEKKTNDGAK